jgi:hypothetical protein
VQEADMDNQVRLWAIADKIRGEKRLDPASVIQAARHAGIMPSAVDYRMLFDRLGYHEEPTHAPARLITHFVAGCIRPIDPSAILDPWCGSGLLLMEVAEAIGAKHVTGVSPNQEWIETAKCVGLTLDASWECGDPLEWFHKNKQEHDLVVTCPPMHYYGRGITPQHVQDKKGNHYLLCSLAKDSVGWISAVRKSGVKFRSLQVSMNPVLAQAESEGKLHIVTADLGGLVLFWSCVRLKQDGVFVGIVPAIDIERRSESSVYSALFKIGFSLHATVQIPPRLLSPTLGIPTAIIVMSRKPASGVFVGQLSGDQKRDKTLLDNMLARRPGAEPTLGAIVPQEEFRSFRILDLDTRIRRLAARSGLGPMPLSELVTEVNLIRISENTFPERDNAVYLPLIGGEMQWFPQHNSRSSRTTTSRSCCIRTRRMRLQLLSRLTRNSACWPESELRRVRLSQNSPRPVFRA